MYKKGWYFKNKDSWKKNQKTRVGDKKMINIKWQTDVFFFLQLENIKETFASMHEQLVDVSFSLLQNYCNLTREITRDKSN